MSELIAETDVLVIGAGFAGASTAYHLRRRGRGRVLIVDQEEVAGVHSSGRNAAIVREHADDPSEQRLVSEGAAALREGSLARFERNGVVLMRLGDTDVAPLFDRARGRGKWCENDGVIDAAALLSAYLKDQQVIFNTEVVGWQRYGNRVGVETRRGDILCNIVVNAAGPWAGRLGGLPLRTPNRHLFMTTPMDWVEPHWPTIWDGPRGLYFRPESGGLLMCCCEEIPAEPGDYREEPRMLAELHEKVCSMQPGLGEVSIQSQWVGQRTFAPGRLFVIGFDPRDDRLFHVAGLGGHGVTASYAIGRLASRLLLGETAEGAEAFAPSRLALAPAPCR